MQEKDNLEPKEVAFAEAEEVNPEEILPPARRVDEILSQADIPAEQKEKIKSQVLVMFEQREYFEGPLPHPKMFKQYESILPGSADRIITMAEKQQDHRMQLEKIAIEGQVKSNVRGQSFGFATFIVGLLVSIAFAYFGMYTYAGILATGTIVTIVGLFLNGEKQIKKDLKEKSKDQ